MYCSSSEHICYCPENSKVRIEYSNDGTDDSKTMDDDAPDDGVNCALHDVLPELFPEEEYENYNNIKCYCILPE